MAISRSDFVPVPINSHAALILFHLSLMKANRAFGSERKQFQEESSAILDYLRIMIRLSKDTRLVSVKQYVTSVEKLNEIGRMLTSWIGVTKSV